MGATTACETTNLVVLTGTITNQPTPRDLRDGMVVNFDVTTASDDAPRLSVPVAWYDPRPSALSGIGEHVDVVVVGTVRRRFFRVGGRTQSRTEVVAESVVPARRSKSVRSALAAAADRLRPAGG